MSRAIDYASMPPRLREHLLQALFACFAKPTPREQLAAAIGLVLGLSGFDLDVDPRRIGTDDAERLNAVFDACADAVLEVLARHDAELMPLRGADG